MRQIIQSGIFLTFTLSTTCWALEDYVEDLNIAYADVRIGYSVPLGSMKGSYQASNGSNQIDRVTWSKAGEVSLKWIPSLSCATESGSGMAAFGMSSTRYELSDQSARQKIEQRVLLGTVDLGLAWVTAPDWTIEGTWHLGIGQAWQPGSSTGSGHAWAGGIATEITKRVWHGLTVGIRGNIEWRSWDDAATLDGIVYQVAFSGLQFVPGLIVGWRF